MTEIKKYLKIGHDSWAIIMNETYFTKYKIYLKKIVPRIIQS